jgi:hypothetical protein
MLLLALAAGGRLDSLSGNVRNIPMEDIIQSG